MSEPIISVSGLRGIVGESLDPIVAARYVAAFVADLPPGPIAVTRDGRTTGAMLEAAVSSALMAAGRTVLGGGITATPTLGILVRHYHAAGGVQISASHNPPEYNGLKLFSGEGRVINAAAGERVLQSYHRGALQWAGFDAVGDAVTLPDTTMSHLAMVLSTVNADRIRHARFRVLLDSNHGAGSGLGRELLEELGCEVIQLGGQPDGHFEHPAEPTEANLRPVAGLVTHWQAAVGFCQDPDADRLAVIDENGRYIGEEYTLALCLDHVLRQHSGKVVANCATSRITQDVAERHGAVFLRSAVGEANVTEMMLANEAVFGGEGNGGPIDPRVGYVRDSFVGMALILDAMAARQMPISGLADELPRYQIHKTTVPLPRQRVPEVLDALEKEFAAARADRQDGLRLDWDDRRWLLVRPSNTEPIVRLITEAPTTEQAQQLSETASAIIASQTGPS